MQTELYESIDMHRMMLTDRIRNQIYRSALFATIRKGDVVLDVGAGSGILSLFAAQAGAAKVYAVERTSTAGLARQLAARNGFGDRIEIIHGDIRDVELPQPVDVLVSEWMGIYAVDENLLALVLEARDRFLRPGGAMVPRRSKVWLAPVWSEERDVALGLLDDVHGLSFQSIAAYPTDDLIWTGSGITPEHLRAAPQVLWDIDLASHAAADARLPFRAQRTFRASGAGLVNGLTPWFDADFGHGLVLSTRPGQPRTHWGHYVLPLSRNNAVVEGTEISAQLTCLPATPGHSHHAWSARVGTGSWEHHDTRTPRTTSQCCDGQPTCVPATPQWESTGRNATHSEQACRALGLPVH
ncbi:MAG: methyltransferase domain-containing protein [Deltaproteobacteria bacterium]|nr:methyltransferase domain-containing protein [Deltaproteobacteria bacterium]